MHSDDYYTAKEIIQLIISRSMQHATDPLTTERIIEVVNQVVGMNPLWATTLDRNRLAREIETIFNTWIGNIRTLDSRTDPHVPWLHSRKAEINWRYWARYEQLLRRQGWSERTIRKLDEMTDHVLGRIEDPRTPGPWDRRGLVVGHIQSGKTSNYIGLINKAVDAGYKVIIVLAGPYNNLRAQTQLRIDEGFLGYDSNRFIQAGVGAIPAIGVGLIDPSVPRPNTGTNSTEEGDFRTGVANNFNINPGNDSLLFVVKKQRSILNRILNWVNGAAQRRTEDGRPIVSDVPLLMIDDEADYGSVDTKANVVDEFGIIDEEHNPTVINGLIRTILFRFEKKIYIGYTATPFANIFIHEQARTVNEGEDLFPRSFITCLPAPSNYVGPARVFGINPDINPNYEEMEGLPLLREVTDHAVSTDIGETEGWIPPKHTRVLAPRYNGEDTVPPSLREAIYSFILSSANRRARGQINVHNSMLIHVTKFTDVQERIRSQVDMEVNAISRRLRLGPGDDPEPIMQVLKSLWEHDHLVTTQHFASPEFPVTNWENIEPFIIPIVRSIQINIVNGHSTDILDYHSYRDTGITVIVIGGDKLSRGLTLEGLTVSYFLRPTKMYDTLMQMGRWFGYRPGYLDLCRLYTRPDIAEWFFHITQADEELRREFDYMADIGATPLDYGLRVRTHPDLAVTSPIKMRNAERVNYSYQFSQNVTTTFHRDPENIHANYSTFCTFLEKLATARYPRTRSPSRPRPNSAPRRWEGATVWENVPAYEITNLLAHIRTYPSAIKVNSNRLREYIELMNERNYFLTWTVFILSGYEEEYPLPVLGNHRLVLRNWSPAVPTERRSGNPTFTIKNPVSPEDETIDLSLDEYNEALRKAIHAYENGQHPRRMQPPSEPDKYSILATRDPRRGVLLIYPIEPNDPSIRGPTDPPLIGFSVSFSKVNPEDDRTVTYIVNNVELHQELDD